METTPQVPPVENKRRSNLLTPEQGLDVRLKDILKLFGFFLLLQTIGMLLYPSSLPENNRAVFDPLMSLLFLWSYNHYGYWPSFADFGLTKEKFLGSLRKGLLWAVGAQGLSYILGKILPIILGPWAKWAETSMDVPVYLWGWVAFFIRVVIFAPIIEEIIFRGIVFGTIRHKSGRRWALVITTLAFTLLHGVNPVSFVQILIPGIAFVLLYEREGSLAAPVITHAGFNLISTLGLLAETFL